MNIRKDWNFVDRMERLNRDPQAAALEDLVREVRRLNRYIGLLVVVLVVDVLLLLVMLWRRGG